MATNILGSKDTTASTNTVAMHTTVLRPYSTPEHSGAFGAHAKRSKEPRQRRVAASSLLAIHVGDRTLRGILHGQDLSSIRQSQCMRWASTCSETTTSFCSAPVVAGLSIGWAASRLCGTSKMAGLPPSLAAS